MKRLLLVLSLGAALVSPTFAQPAPSTNAPPSGPPPGGFHHDHGMGMLTDAEKQELQKARDLAVQADPALGTEGAALKEKMEAAHESGGPPSDDLRDQMHAFREKMNAAMVKADPNVAPIIAKIEAAHKHHDGPGAGGPPSPPPAGA